MSNAAFDDDLREPAAPKSSKTCLIVSLIFGGLLLGCVCCSGIGYFGLQTSGAELGKMISTGVADNEAIQQHIGEITSSKLLWMETFEFVADTGLSNYYVVELHGTKGTGRLTIQVQGRPPAADLETGELTLSDGTVVPLVEPAAVEAPAEGPAPPEPPAPAEAPPGTN